MNRQLVRFKQTQNISSPAMFSLRLTCPRYRYANDLTNPLAEHVKRHPAFKKLPKIRDTSVPER